MNNPRFPHSLQFKREVRDSSGNIVQDDYGKVTYEVVTLAKALMFDGEVMRDDDGVIETEDVTSIEFGYRTETRSTKTEGDVTVGQIVLHTPLFLTELQYNDIAEVTDAEGTYKASIVDKKNFNWGTNVFINKIGN